MFDAKTKDKVTEITFSVFKALEKSERDETKEQDVNYAIVTDWYDGIEQFQRLKGIRVTKIVYSDGLIQYGIAKEIKESKNCIMILAINAEDFDGIEIRAFITTGLFWLAEKQE